MSWGADEPHVFIAHATQNFHCAYLITLFMLNVFGSFPNELHIVLKKGLRLLYQALIV